MRSQGYGWRRTTICEQDRPNYKEMATSIRDRTDIIAKKLYQTHRKRDK